MKQAGLVLIKKIKNKLVIDYSQTYPKKHIEVELNSKTSIKNNEIEITRS